MRILKPNRYQTPAVLLEPLLVSDAEQARWVHNRKNVENLAGANAACIRGRFPEGTGRALSRACLQDELAEGRGCQLRLGEHKADHAIPLVEQVPGVPREESLGQFGHEGNAESIT